MQEVVSKRTKRSKTFLLDDGVTYRTEIGPHAHHQKDGIWVETDTAWTDDASKYGVGEFPLDISFTKATRTLSITFDNGDVVTMSPRGARTPTSITRDGSSVTFTRLWTGIDMTISLTPDGVSFSYVKTSTTFVNPAYNITGPFSSYDGPNHYHAVFTGVAVTVPQTVTANRVTYDFSGVPVGAEVS